MTRLGRIGIWRLVVVIWVAQLWTGEAATSETDVAAYAEQRLRTALASPQLPCHEGDATRVLALARLVLVAPNLQPGSRRTLAASLLERVARSELYDHLGGGFFEPECRADLLEAGFDKRLATSALLLNAFIRGYEATGMLLFREIADETIGFMVRDLRGTNGAFFSGIRAGSPAAARRHYLWTEDEIRRFLGRERSEEFLTTYDISGGRLRLTGDPFAGLASSRGVLLVRRSRRVRLEVDTRVDGKGNGLAIAALSRAGRALGRGFATEAARRAARVLQRSRLSVDAMPHIAAAFIELHRSTGEAEWRVAGTAMADQILLDRCRIVPHFGQERLACSWDGDGASAPGAALLAVLSRMGRQGDPKYARQAGRLEATLREGAASGSAAEDALYEALWSAEE